MIRLFEPFPRSILFYYHLELLTSNAFGKKLHSAMLPGKAFTMKASTTAKRGRVAGSYLNFFVPLCYLAGVLYDSIWAWNVIIFIFLIIPILDLVVGKDMQDFRSDDFTALQKNLMASSIPGYCALYVVCLFATLEYASTFTTPELLLLTCSCGLVGAIGIACSHELIHARSKLKILVGRIPLLLTGYLHFEIAHQHSHHRYSHRPLDESSSRRGESFYQYLPRVFVGEYRSTNQYEQARVNRIRTMPATSKVNVQFWHGTAYAVLCCCVTLWAGTKGLAFLLGQALIARIATEIMNYIAHYGLRQEWKQVAAWDAYYRFSAYLTCTIPRHSDHHRNTRRPHYELRTSTSAPQMPVGYPLMMLMALIPSLWRRVMDPCLDRFADTERLNGNVPTDSTTKSHPAVQ